MAELVHLRLEQSLPELEEMERVGLFNKEEIRNIIKKRKALEYKLRRKTKRKEDYLKLIEYEMNVLSLIEKRRERLMCDDKKKEIDDSIAKRINKMFKVVVSRYPEDEKLFLDQIQFCKKMKWYELVNSLHTRMLQIHSRNPALWIAATKWEMEELRSPEAARKLMQRAILLNSDSGILWREYYRMELMYTDMIRKRRTILESQSIKDTGDVEDAVLNGDIANVVFMKATEEFDDVEYALSFIQVCLEFEFGKKHIDYILNHLLQRFPDHPQTIDALAKRPLLHIEDRIKEGKEMGVKKKQVLAMINTEICNKYEEAIQSIATEKMWSLYIDFLLSLFKCATDKKKTELQNKLISVMERAAASDCLHVSYYLEWIDLLFERGDEEDALSTSIVASRKFNKVDFWFRCLTYHIQCMRPHEQIYLLLIEAINGVEEKDSVTLWKMGVDWLSVCDSDRLIEFFESGIKKNKIISTPLKEMYLDTVALQQGVDAARALYKRFKKLGPLFPQVIKKIIIIEKGQLNPPIEDLRRYYEDGIKEFGTQNVEIWLEFMKLEMEHVGGDPSLYGIIYWRAKKLLNAELLKDFNVRALELTTRCNLPSSALLTA